MLMNTSTEINSTVFSKTIKNFGEISLRPLDIDKDLATIHSWVTQAYAYYWGMLDKTKEEVYAEYANLIVKEDYEVYIGIYRDETIFLMEKYKASSDRIANYYTAKATDYGMHILIAPPKNQISGFTWNIFSTVLEYFFSQPQVGRVVVEPDIRNQKIHKLNKKAGFIYTPKCV